MRQARSLAVVLAVLFAWSASALADEKPIEIPLKDVWAYEMPGTRDIRELVRTGDHGKSVLASIRELLARRSEGKNSQDGFIITTKGIAALQYAAEVLSGRTQRSGSISSSQEAAIFFFSRLSIRYVQLRRVERSGNIVRIEYRLVPHRTKEVTTHFAFIPLGKLSPGKVLVEVKQSPMPDKYARQGFQPLKAEEVRRIVCHSFEFTVSE